MIVAWVVATIYVLESMKKLHTYALYSAGFVLSLLGIYISTEFVTTPDKGLIAQAPDQCVDISSNASAGASQENENQLLFVSCGGFIE